MKKLVILSGSGLDQESGINTFRDNKIGMWEEYKVEDVADIRGWNLNQERVLNFYNQRRRQLVNVEPNEAHKLLAKLENSYDVTHITQNVTNLLEKAGCSKIIHLHGELMKSCSEDKTLVYNLESADSDIKLGDLAEDGSQLRPFIVWFGESVPLMADAMDAVNNADIFVIIGTSLQVYPAANLIYEFKEKTPVYVIDPALINDDIYYYINGETLSFQHIQKKAVEGVAELYKMLTE